MKSNIVIIALILLAAAGFYFLGKRNGEANMQSTVVQNVAMVKEIAQLASLQVSGTTNIKMTNKAASGGMFDRLKNYLVENTLQLSIPYEAKYGVDMSNQKVVVDTKAGTAIIYLPAVKLMSMQLRLDKLQSMTQAGILNSVSIDDFVKAQKEIYSTASATLENNQGFIKLSQDNISNTLNKYYAPLGYKVKCVFGAAAPTKL
ncbi:MAG: DUF4230 domain-containing protein [Sphingobacteriales bacterium]|nr:MAG: DUF4230 domain-containing protein [Sphingobacteriales bacterium]